MNWLDIEILACNMYELSRYIYISLAIYVKFLYI